MDTNKVTEILAQRGNEYGSYDSVALTVHQLKGKMTTKSDDRNIMGALAEAGKRTKVVMELSAQMLAVKTARLSNTPEHEDTKLDMHGYARLLHEHIKSIEPLSVRYDISLIVKDWIKNIVTLANKTTSINYKKALMYLAHSLSIEVFGNEQYIQSLEVIDRLKAELEKGTQQ